MRLERPFYQLPILFDVARLQTEVAALPAEAWAPHPDRIPGNSAVRLISTAGGETDAVHGPMQPTRWMAALPYVRQVLAGFGVVWGRSRLMRLAAGARVPEHADIDYHWHTRVRVHIPIVTAPGVRFHCDGQSVHMAAGAAWIFDNWRPHHVENDADTDRIHLVADTTGTAAFWRFACEPPPTREHWPTLPWAPSRDAQLLTEADQRTAVMSAAEVQWLVDDLRADLAVARTVANSDGEQVARFDRLLADFVLDWRQLWALHGGGEGGWPDFLRLRDAVRASAASLSAGVVMRTNHVRAGLVLERRVLQHLLSSKMSG